VPGHVPRGSKGALVQGHSTSPLASPRPSGLAPLSRPVVAEVNAPQRPRGDQHASNSRGHLALMVRKGSVGLCESPPLLV
jgi:hypothetical protein